LDVNGSPVFALTWKAMDMPSGLPICALRASGRSTSGSGSIGWPTPQQHDAATPKTPEQVEASKARAKKRKNGGTAGYRNLNEEAQQVGWPSPQSRDGAHSRSGQIERTGGRRRNLDDYVTLAGWATPAAQEAGGTPEQFLARKEKAIENGASLGMSLTSLSLQVAAWATPAQERGGSTKGEQLNNQVVHHGQMPSGSTAATASAGQLNPAFSLWLMGFPLEWESCAPPATRSSRRLPPSS
jgi:hypothetical protein